MEAHNTAVTSISERVKQFHARKEPFRMYHGSTNTTRRSTRRVDNTVDSSGLNHVLEVNTTSKTALVEPNVPMDALVNATMKHGLVPLVVMEFPGITTGGGFSGTSGESSSFRHGVFEMTINSIEIVLPDGTITKASKTEKPDLFWGAASAFGTLGVVTLLEVQLKEAKKYVALTYQLCTGPSDTVTKMREECDKESNDYIDGVAFSLDEALLCVGRLTDEVSAGQKPLHLTRRGDKWFCLQAEQVHKKLKKDPATTITDYIPLADYLFRWDRGGFWVARYSFKYFLTPFNRITRYILDSLLRARVMYPAGHKSGLFDYYLLQDVAVPFDKFVEFQNFLDKELSIYPLWLCPLHVQRDAPDSAHGLNSRAAKPGTPDLINFGVWGPLPGTRREVIRQNRAMEQKVAEFQGMKCLYAHAYYTEDEFWSHYDRESYDKLRAKYAAEYLPSIYDKVKVDVNGMKEAELSSTVRTHWPTQGLRGVYRAVVGGDYLLQKKKKHDTVTEEPKKP